MYRPPRPPAVHSTNETRYHFPAQPYAPRTHVPPSCLRPPTNPATQPSNKTSKTSVPLSSRPGRSPNARTPSCLRSPTTPGNCATNELSDRLPDLPRRSPKPRHTDTIHTHTHNRQRPSNKTRMCVLEISARERIGKQTVNSTVRKATKFNRVLIHQQDFVRHAIQVFK